MAKTRVAVMGVNGVIDFGNGDTIDMNEVDSLYKSARKAVGVIHDEMVAQTSYSEAFGERPFDESDYCGAGW